MRVRTVVAWIVVAVVAAMVVRACAAGGPPAPLANDVPAPAVEEVVPVDPPPARTRVRVRPPEPGPGDESEAAVVAAAPRPLVDGEVDEEHRGGGEETLDLSLVDAATERRIGSRVRLWRLGVPADDRWPEGDHIQSEFNLEGTHRVTGLPAGRYRLEVWAAAPGTEDPPELVVVAGRQNAFTARVELPDEVPMGLRVHDELGVLAGTATRRSRGTGTSWSGRADAPSWARPRSRRDRDSTAFRGGGGRRNLPVSEFYPVEAVHGVFELGSIRRSGRNLGWSRQDEFYFPDRTHVSVRARSEDADEGRSYVAVTVPPQPLLDAVRLPDGTRAADAGGYVEVVCEAVPVPPGDQVSWRTVPVRVTIEPPGYEKLEFTWCIDDGTPQPRTLTPIAAPDR